MLGWSSLPSPSHTKHTHTLDALRYHSRAKEKVRMYRCELSLVADSAGVWSKQLAAKEKSISVFCTPENGKLMEQNIANHKEEKKIQFHAVLDFGKAVPNLNAAGKTREKRTTEEEETTARIFTIYDAQTYLHERALTETGK